MDAWLCNVYLLELQTVEPWICELQWLWKEAPIPCFFFYYYPAMYLMEPKKITEIQALNPDCPNTEKKF
jgi:hypothetical protein